MREIKDPKDFGRVAVLMGGTSSEREVSLNSGANVLEALRSLGVDAEPVDGIPALITALGERRFDRVFNILHGNRGGGEDGVLQGLLDAVGVPYTGPGVLGSALTMDKIRTKQVWLSAGLPTPKYVRLAPGDDVHVAAKLLGLPVFVKPACEGSSVGISRVLDDAGLEEAVALAARYPGDLLMEQLIVGEELTVGILGDTALPSVRIVTASGFYDYHAKYISDETRYECPALSGEAEAEVRALAMRAFAAAGCTGWGRVDAMRDTAGKPWLLEINTAPGMTSHSLVPKAAKEIGIDFPTLCWRILETSFKEGRPR
jgi:D-alanine-D-alanine ligase